MPSKVFLKLLRPTKDRIFLALSLNIKSILKISYVDRHEPIIRSLQIRKEIYIDKL